MSSESESDASALERVSVLRLAERARPMSQGVPILRCAIYTRKSTDEGLEQAFNTLQAQREAAEAYIQSQRQAGCNVMETDSVEG